MWQKRALLLVLALFLASCTTPLARKTAKVNKPVVPPKPLYLGTEFPDIVVPRGMQVVQEKSMVVKTNTYIGGVLTLRGRIKVDSLVEFFKSQLTARGWELNGSIRYKDTLLAFNRPHGCCFVYISESGFGTMTEVQIWASEMLETTE